MRRLEGKVAVITGGASGIGAATARRFVAEGARVLIADLQDNVAAALARDLGAETTAVRCNVAQEAEVAGAIQAAVERWGRLDVLFNNAGFGGASGPLEETSVADYDLTLDVLLKSVFLGIKHAAPVMKAQGGGSIINTASVCSFQAGIGSTLYTVAKAGVLMLAQAAALDLAEYSIRVNAVCPGFAESALVEPIRDDLIAQGFDVMPAEDVAQVVVNLFAGDMAGECWFVQPGRVGAFEFRHVPGPRRAPAA